MKKSKNKISINEAILKAKQICSIKECCIKEIEDKLINWNINDKYLNKIINQLVSGNYIDEKRYARAYVKDKYRFNKWGRNKIIYQLKSKNISQEIIGLALKEIDEKEYEAILKKVLSDKLKTIKQKNKTDTLAKLVRFATGKGYEYNTVTNIARNLTDAKFSD